MKKNVRIPDIEQWSLGGLALGCLGWGQGLMLNQGSSMKALFLTFLGLALGWAWWAGLTPSQAFAWVQSRLLIPAAASQGRKASRGGAAPARGRLRQAPSEGLSFLLPRSLLLGLGAALFVLFQIVSYLVLDRDISFWPGFGACLLLGGACAITAFTVLPKPGLHILVRIPRPKAGPLALVLGGLSLSLTANILYAGHDEWYWGFSNAAGLGLVLLAFPSRLWKGHPSEPPRPTLTESLGWSPQTRALLRGVVACLALGLGRYFWDSLPLGTTRGLLTYAVLAMVLLWALPRNGIPTLQSLSSPLSRALGKSPAALTLKLAEAAILALLLREAYLGQSQFAAQQVSAGMRHMGWAVLLSILLFPEDGRFEKTRRWPKSLDFVLLSGLIVLAAWWRSRRLADHPFGFENDESGAIIWALDILYDKVTKLTAYGHYLMMAWIQAAMIHFRGGLDRVGARLPGVMVGVLTIPAFFFLLRIQFNRRVALAGAFLLAVCRWHLAYSRSAHWIIMLPLFQILCFYWLLKGLKTGRRGPVILSAMALSLTMVTHLAARLVPPMLVIYLVYKIVMVKDYLAPRWKAALVLLTASWILSMPYGIEWIKNPHMLFNPRIGEVSIAATAPAGKVLAETMESARRTILMFNVQGDLRQRNNGGLSGETEVDFWTGMLFALGLGYALFHWKRDRNFLMLIWFGLTLCASIFAVESPQAYRSFGNVPAVLYFSCLALRNIWAAFLRIFSLRLEVLFAGLFLWLAAKGPGTLPMGIARKNYDRYFNAVLGGLDETATGAGEFAASVIKDHDVVLMTAYYYAYHPPFRIWVYNQEPRNCSFLAQAAPFTWDTEKGAAYITSINYGPMADTVKDLFYPNAKIVQFDHPLYGRIHRSVLIDKEDVQALRGLTLKQYKAGRLLEESRIKVLDGGDSPFRPDADSAEIRGSIFSEDVHPRVLGLRTDGEARADVAACAPVAAHAGEASATLPLGWGLQPIKISWRRGAGKEGRLQLFTLAPGGARVSYPAGWLFNIQENHGLVCRYFPTDNWTGPPQQTYVDPLVLVYWLTSPLPTPFTARWDGWVEIPKAGTYGFRLQTSGYGRVDVDSRTGFERGLKTPMLNKGDNPQGLTLSPGWHRITAYWRSYYGPDVELRWTPPGSAEDVIPGKNLRPDYAALGRNGEGLK